MGTSFFCAEQSDNEAVLFYKDIIMYQMRTITLFY